MSIFRQGKVFRELLARNGPGRWSKHPIEKSLQMGYSRCVIALEAGAMPPDAQYPAPIARRYYRMVQYRNDLQKEIEELKRRARGVFARKRRERIPAERPSGLLEQLVPGEEVTAGEMAFYRVLAEAATIWEDADQIHREYLETLAHPFVPDTKGLEALETLKNTSPEKICYLDIETTGLSMVPLFLVGLMYSEGEKLMMDQLFARDYTEERAVLDHLKGSIGTYEVLVTFNGVHFDMPFIQDRMRFSSIEFVPPVRHVDLLPLSRRLLGKRTPNHKLQTLEVYLLSRKRTGDVPGSEIPGVYHEFVRNGDAGGIAGVIHHNRLDLLTMLQLVTVYLTGRHRTSG
jgi:uncharacterized protein YprB with RNaseH-like and TPR domain